MRHASPDGQSKQSITSRRPRVGVLPRPGRRHARVDEQPAHPVVQVARIDEGSGGDCRHRHPHGQGRRHPALDRCGIVDELSMRAWIAGSRYVAADVHDPTDTSPGAATATTRIATMPIRTRTAAGGNRSRMVATASEVRTASAGRSGTTYRLGRYGTTSRMSSPATNQPAAAANCTRRDGSARRQVAAARATASAAPSTSGVPIHGVRGRSGADLRGCRASPVGAMLDPVPAQY